MKNILVISVVAVLLSACAGGPRQRTGPYGDAHKIPYGDRLVTHVEGASAHEREADRRNSPYYVSLDFYNMKSNNSLTILPQFRTIQQATEWTCGPASVLMVLDYLGVRGSYNEADLVPFRNNPVPGATTLSQMIAIFKGFGEKEGVEFTIESTFDLEDPDAIPESYILDSLRAGLPVIIGWEEWGGHWQVVIGYDTMGTGTIADDVLILAEPYDTTDHDQDGYFIESFSRLYYHWKNTFDPDFTRNVFLRVGLKRL